MATFDETATGGILAGGLGLIPDPLVVITDIQQIDLFNFLFTFRSLRVPPVTFTVFVEGHAIQSFVSTTGLGQAVVTVGIGESPYVEITDNANQRHHPAYPGRFHLNWRQVDNARSYEVQQYISGSWTTRETRIEDGTANHIYQTDWLDDSTEYQFRVRPLDSVGAAGTPITFTNTMVRHPDPPQLTYEWDSDEQTLTIT